MSERFSAERIGLYAGLFITKYIFPPKSDYDVTDLNDGTRPDILEVWEKPREEFGELPEEKPTVFDENKKAMKDSTEDGKLESWLCALKGDNPQIWNKK